jgi:hypothetical protein
MDFYIAIGSLLLDVCVLILGVNTEWTDKRYIEILCKVCINV